MNEEVTKEEALKKMSHYANKVMKHEMNRRSKGRPSSKHWVQFWMAKVKQYYRIAYEKGEETVLKKEER